MTMEILDSRVTWPHSQRFYQCDPVIGPFQRLWLRGATKAVHHEPRPANAACKRRARADRGKQLVMRNAILLLLPAATTPRATPRAVDVAIIGGGPCGLATALALSQAPCLRGRRVAIYERDSLETNKGAALALSKPGWAALETLDAEAATRIRALGAPVTRIRARALDGSPLAPRVERMQKAAAGYARQAAINAGLARDERQRTHLWSDVRGVLAERVREQLGPDALHLAHPLVAIAERAPSDGVDLTFRPADDGAEERVRAEIVLACDGASSMVRRLAPAGPRASELLLGTGKTAWRGIAPSAHARGIVTRFAGASKSGPMLGLTFPAGPGRGVSWTVTGSSPPGRAADAEHARERLLRALPPDMCAQLRDVIHASPCVLEHKIVVRDFEQPWSSGCERIAYMGDAAHPLRPTGEGTALAFEDAVVLGEIAHAVPSAAEFLSGSMLREFEARRLPRVRAVSEETSALANRAYVRAPSPRSAANAEPARVHATTAGTRRP